MKILKSIVLGGAGAALAVILLVTLYRNWKASLYEDLSPAKIADLDASNFAMLLIGVALVVLIVVVLWAARTGAFTRPQRDAERSQGDVVEGNYRELSNYHAPVAQLPGPRYINVPIMHVNGNTQPIGASAETVLCSQIEDTTTHQQVELQVPLRYMYRFASLPTPARSEWTGKPVIYGQALALFREHGFLDQQGGGYRWKDAFSKQARLDWLEQFNTPATPDTHTHDGLPPLPYSAEREQSPAPGYPVTGNRVQERGTGTGNSLETGHFERVWFERA